MERLTCSEIEVFAVNNARITGRLVAPEGANVSGVYVNLKGVSSQAGAFTQTQEDGSFEFVGVLRGTYQVGVNMQCGAHSFAPYPRTLARDPATPEQPRRYVVDGPVTFEDQELSFRVPTTAMRVRVLTPTSVGTREGPAI